MQWLMLLPWAALVRYGVKRPQRRMLTAAALTAGLLISMASQLWLLALDGQLNLSTGLPLHLCGMMAVLCLPLCWFSLVNGYMLLLLLGVPGAVLALCFPAVIDCSHPLLMRLAFCRVHVLILATAMFRWHHKKPPPMDARSSFLLGNGFLLITACVNQTLDTNYLFLRAAPVGTPLALLIVRGYGFYVASLEMLCMLMMRLLCDGYRLIAGNKSACSPRNRYSVPCTILNQD